MRIEGGNYPHEVCGDPWYLNVKFVDPKFLALLHTSMPDGVNGMNTSAVEFSGHEGAPSITYFGLYGQRVVRI